MNDLYKLDPEWAERMKRPQHWHIAEQFAGLEMLGVLQPVEPAHIVTVRGVTYGNLRTSLAVEDWADITGLNPILDVKYGKYMLIPVDAARGGNDE